MIRVPLGKGCYLLLTEEEYRRGIRRGKGERRWLGKREALEEKAEEEVEEWEERQAESLMDKD